MPCLVEAYLHYHSCNSDEGFPQPSAATKSVDPPSGTISNVELIDLFGMLTMLLDYVIINVL